MTNPKNTSSDRRTAKQEGNDLDTALTELHQTIVRLNKVIEQVKAMPVANHSNAPASAPQNQPLTLQNLVIPKILH